MRTGSCRPQVAPPVEPFAMHTKLPWVAALILLISFGAAAQSSSHVGAYSAMRFTPALGPRNYGMVDGTWVGGHMAPSLLLILDYAHRPFVLSQNQCAGSGTECENVEYVRNVVSYQLTAHLAGTLSLHERLQLGLYLPVVSTSGQGFHSSYTDTPDQPISLPGGKAFTLGDPRLSAKLRLYGRRSGDGFSLAAVAYSSAPLGKHMAPNRGVGQKGITAGGHLVAELHMNRLRLALNLGGLYRPLSKIITIETGSEFTYGLAGGYALTSQLDVLAEVTGNTRLSANADEDATELRVLTQMLAGEVRFTAGAGIGLAGGVGVPDFRALFGAQFSSDISDSDDDGIRNIDDRCPTVPEDLDGYQDDDGCPEMDNDGDDLDDIVDDCPNEPEDLDGYMDQDGCPDKDNDGDGIEDGYDSCKEDPEDIDGDRDEDGCPDFDRDRDGVEDTVDKCPNEPEDTDGFADEDGCPEVDFDGDNIPDDQDYCPELKEDGLPPDPNDGCPRDN